MQTFYEQPSRQTFPKKMASSVPVSYLGLKDAYFKTCPHMCKRVQNPFHKNADFVDDFSVNVRLLNYALDSSIMFLVQRAGKCRFSNFSSPS